MYLTKEELAAYEQQCRENREAWERDQSGRSLVGSPFLVAEEGAGGRTSAGQALRDKPRGRKPAAKNAQQRPRSADRLADQVRTQERGIWVPEPGGRKRRSRSADKLTERMLGGPGGERA